MVACLLHMLVLSPRLPDLRRAGLPLQAAAADLAVLAEDHLRRPRAFLIA